MEADLDGSSSLTLLRLLERWLTAMVAVPVYRLFHPSYCLAVQQSKSQTSVMMLANTQATLAKVALQEGHSSEVVACSPTKVEGELAELALVALGLPLT